MQNISSRSLVGHRFWKIRISNFKLLFVVAFYRQAQLILSKQIFEIRHLQIDELPRTYLLKKIYNPFPTSQFQNQRFEMVIVMPEMYKGLKFFADSAKTGLDNPLAENIFRKALDALEPERKTSKEYTINMPTFTVDSNIDVNKYLRAVRTTLMPRCTL